MFLLTQLKMVYVILWHVLQEFKIFIQKKYLYFLNLFPTEGDGQDCKWAKPENSI